MLRWLASLLSWGYARHIDPPVSSMDSEFAAALAAETLARMEGGSVYLTTGTPSMVPLIPAAPTYVVAKPTVCDDRILGRVCIYSADWSKAGPPCHRIVGKFPFGHGYIASGDNNAHSEPNCPVTSKNLLGEVVGIFLFPSSNSTATKPSA